VLIEPPYCLGYLPTHFLQGFSGSAGGSSLFLPEGAVGVFDLPTTWAVVKSATSTDVPVIDSYVQQPTVHTTTVVRRAVAPTEFMKQGNS
jgi:hypothetical protein